MSEAQWQLEGPAADLYQRYLVPTITIKWAEDLVVHAQPRAGETVLDVACGTGVVARLAARRVAAGQVTGLDLNADMLAVARSLPSEAQPVSWVEGSALDLPFRSESFDLVLCQLGLQFFPDQPKALGTMGRLYVTGYGVDRDPKKALEMFERAVKASPPGPEHDQAEEQRAALAGVLDSQGKNATAANAPAPAAKP